MKVLMMLAILSALNPREHELMQLFTAETDAYVKLMGCIDDNETKTKIRACVNGVTDELETKMKNIVKEYKDNN